MKISYMAICCILMTTPLSPSQNGIYSIVAPEGKSINTFEEYRLKRVIGDTIKEIIITEYISGWRNKHDAKKELMGIFEDKEIITSSRPIWNMDFPLELIGIIVYKNGAKGKFAVAQHRVGFQDSHGNTWYFQWKERIPWKK